MNVQFLLTALAAALAGGWLLRDLWPMLRGGGRCPPDACGHCPSGSCPARRGAMLRGKDPG
ncbi:MAG: hypothetical protein HY823_01780 [Acidobacteria bacterium]|nr:hypothetical protein [Acidobacteriota bacterium]